MNVIINLQRTAEDERVLVSLANKESIYQVK